MREKRKAVASQSLCCKKTKTIPHTTSTAVYTAASNNSAVISNTTFPAPTYNVNTATAVSVVATVSNNDNTPPSNASNTNIGTTRPKRKRKAVQMQNINQTWYDSQTDSCWDLINNLDPVEPPKPAREKRIKVLPWQQNIDNFTVTGSDNVSQPELSLPPINIQQKHDLLSKVDADKWVSTFLHLIADDNNKIEHEKITCGGTLLYAAAPSSEYDP